MATLGTAPKARVRETSTSTGTGNFVLDGAKEDKDQAFLGAYGGGTTLVPYLIAHQDAAEWEEGLATVQDDGTGNSEIVRGGSQTVTASSNGGSAVPFSTGTKDVFSPLSAEQSQALFDHVNSTANPHGVTAELPYTADFPGASTVNLRDELDRRCVTPEMFWQQALGATGPADLTDGSTDAAPAIRAAIDAVKSVGGGTVECSAGTYAVETPIVIDSDHILLSGKGRGQTLSSKVDSRNNAGTRFLRTGGNTATILTFTSNTANDGSTLRKSGGGVVNIMLDGNETAGRGLEVISWAHGVFYITTAYFTDIHWHVFTLTNGTTVAPGDTQYCDFNIRSHDVNTNSEANALGVINGNKTTNTNTSMNKFNLALTAESAASALELGNCDGNQFEYVVTGTRVTSVGNGGKVICHADDTMTVEAAGGESRLNTFEFLQATKGIIAKKTINGSFSSSNNVQLLSKGNGVPDPIIEDGAILTYFKSSKSGGSYLGTTFTGVLANLSADQSLNSGSFTTIVFDFEKVDTENAYDTSTGVVTVPSGVSCAETIAQVKFTPNGNGARLVRITSNPSLENIPIASAASDANVGTRINVSAIFTNLSAGDTIKVEAWQNSGGTLNVLGDEETHLTVRFW